MASFYLIRHAEPELRGVFLGQLDPPLSAAGHAQAAASLATLPAAIVYTSPLARALQTAHYLRAPEYRILLNLREMHQGEWTGKTWAQIESGWSDVVARKQLDWLAVTPPGAEPWPQFLARIRQTWRTIREGPQPAAVVAHQAVNAALAHLACGTDPLTFFQQYGEVTHVEYS